MPTIIPPAGNAMQKISLTTNGLNLDWDLARDLALTIASHGGEEVMLMSWYDKKRDKFSPSCCQCDIKEGPAWEIYGKNHGGRLRISINADEYVFIYT